jgi:hypothetical protein
MGVFFEQRPAVVPGPASRLQLVASVRSSKRWRPRDLLQFLGPDY